MARAAIVTGASAGLGEAVAQELCRSEADVLICSRSAERLDAAAGRIASATGRRPVIHAADVTDPHAAPRLIDAAHEAFGRIDALVCNAGGPPPGDFADMCDDDWEAAFQLIVLGAIRLIRAALPALRESGVGRIAMIASISGLRPVSRLVLSNTLRPALMGLARHLAIECGPENVLVNAVAPGFFETERAREVQAAMAAKAGRSLEEVAAETAARVPLGRQGDPAELGKHIAYLVSAENTYITGQTLVVDGGLMVAT